MPLPEDELRARKEEALKNAEKIFDRFQANEETRNKYVWDDIVKRIEDPKRFDQFQKLRGSIATRKEQAKLLDRMIDESPELSDSREGPFAECIEMYLHLDGTRESIEHNQSILKKYATPEGKLEMAKEAISKMLAISPKDIFDTASDPEKMTDFIVENRLLVEQCSLAEKILYGLRDTKMSLDFKEMYLGNQKFLSETMFTLINYEYVMESELCFFIEDLSVMPSKEELDSMMFSFAPDGEYWNEMKGLTYLSKAMGDLKAMQARKDSIEGVDLEKPIGKLKAVDESGREVPLDQAFKKSGVSIRERSAEELEKTSVETLSVDFNKIERRKEEQRRENEAMIANFKRGVKERVEDLLDRAVSHNQKRQPGFFSRLFNTQYNQTYNREKQEIATQREALEDLGVTKETLDDIVKARDKEHAPVDMAISDALKEFCKYRDIDEKGKPSNAKEQIAVDEFERTATRQNVVGAKERVHTTEKGIALEGPQKG